MPWIPTVTLYVDNGAEIIGASNTFAAQAGAVAGFQWSTIASPEYQNVAFPVTLTATDANGYTVTGYNGAATLKGFSGVQGTIDSFDQGSSDLSNYTFTGTNNAAITAPAAHDGPYGLQLGDTTEWMYRNDAAAHVQQGSDISVWVKSSTSTSGRAYFGFGATSTGTLAMTMGENTGTLLLQYVSPYSGSYTTLASMSQTWTANHWYRFEVDWQNGGTIVGRLYDSDGTTLLNSVTGTNTNITAGGIAFRGFGSTKYFDSVSGPASAAITVAPATVTLVSGVWTGNVTVQQAANAVYLRVDDGTGHVSSSSTFNVRAETAPTATARLNTHAPLTNDLLTATATKSDPDGDPVSLTYVWKVNGAVKQTHVSAAALTDTFDLGLPGNGDCGDVITVEVTSNDGFVNGATVADTATVAYNLPGDANLDGTVNGADLNIVLSYYNQTGMDWAHGDFNGDGVVNGADLNTVLSNYNQSIGLSACDVTAPTVTINQAENQADPTSTSPIHFTVVFSEPVSDFTAGDVTLGGTALGKQVTNLSGGGTTYDVEVGGMTGSGTVVASIAAGTVHDAAGNPNTASTSPDNAVRFTMGLPLFALTAPAGGTYVAGQDVTFQWIVENARTSSKIRLCYDEDRVWDNGNEHWIEVDQIAAANGQGSYVWNTADVPAGTYYIAGDMSDGAARVATPIGRSRL